MIFRAPQEAARRAYDVIVIGGGILGACHALEATRRGLSVLLLERDDFGGATSWSSHRIVHGAIAEPETREPQPYLVLGAGGARKPTAGEVECRQRARGPRTAIRGAPVKSVRP